MNSTNGIPVRGEETGHLYCVLPNDDPETIEANRPEMFRAALPEEDHWFRTEACRLTRHELFVDPTFMDGIGGDPLTSRSILLRPAAAARALGLYLTGPPALLQFRTHVQQNQDIFLHEHNPQSQTSVIRRVYVASDDVEQQQQQQQQQ